MSSERSSGKVAKLVTRATLEPNQEIVEALEAMLEKAKAGEIRGLATCFENSDATISTNLILDYNRFAMSHAISALWFNFQQKMADDSE